MQRIDIRFRVHGNSLDSKFTRSFHYTARYFTAIGDKNFINFALMMKERMRYQDNTKSLPE